MLSLEVRDFPAASTQALVIDGVTVGQISIDADGDGRLTFASDPMGPDELAFPSAFPAVGPGAWMMVGELASAELSVDGVNVDESDERSANHLTLMLNAVLQGDGVTHGRATYETEEVDGIDTHELEIEVADAIPGSSHELLIDGVPAYVLVVDDAEYIAVKFSSSTTGTDAIPFPAGFPVIAANSVLTVGAILEGVFVPRGSTAPLPPSPAAPPDDHQVEGIELRAVLTSNGGYGFAEFAASRQRDSLNRELEIEVTDLSPNTAQVIEIDGIEVAMINVNAEGEGKLVLSSQPSHSDQGHAAKRISDCFARLGDHGRFVVKRCLLRTR